MKLTVEQIDSKSWGLFIDGRLLGTSKNRFDADHGRAIIENALNRVASNMDLVHEDDPTIFPGVYTTDHGGDF